MNASEFPVALTVMIIIVILLPLYRLYKRICRRCCDKDCGSLSVRRRQFIFLPPEEYDLSFPLFCPTSPLPEKIVSLRHPIGTLRWLLWGRLFKGVPRWFIRRVVKVTISDCRNDATHHRRIRLAKIDMDPISLWHAWWVKWFHKEQYYPLMEYRLPIQEMLRQLYRNEPIALDKDSTDTPDLLEGILRSLKSLADPGNILGPSDKR